MDVQRVSGAVACPGFATFERRDVVTRSLSTKPAYRTVTVFDPRHSIHFIDWLAHDIFVRAGSSFIRPLILFIRLEERSLVSRSRFEPCEHNLSPTTGNRTKRRETASARRSN